MDRRVLKDGRWFDADRAEVFDETRRHDGRNMVSRATGDQWLHETLYRTASGRWVLSRSSDWQGSGPETYREVTDEDAARWLVRCGYDAHEACAEAFRALDLDAEVES